MLIQFKLNGEPTSLDTDPARPLLWVLRTDLALTGTKCGCAIGLCGACTVLINGIAARSCLATIGQVNQAEIVTIEGVADGDQLHPLQQAFVDESAMQCGFCTPGMILSGLSLLRANPNPTEADVVSAMNRNLCRCGAHPRVVRAILGAAQKVGGTP
jgi:aerobic-type carbon monoxide dehydrogenase small subunit (CoxS/CutS family)